MAQPAPPPSKPQASPGGGPVAPAPARVPAQVGSGKGGGKSALTGWLRVLLGVLIAAGMTQSPYAHGCGLQLYLYLGAAGVVVVAGMWGMVASWKRRLQLAHVIALATVLFGALLVGREILDRSAYVKLPKPWSCP